MNKQELVSQISDKSGLTKSDTQKAIDTFFEVLIENLRRGEDTMLSGLGSFKLTDRGAYAGRNPRTGESISIAASKSVKFKPGKFLKDAIN